jgi:hypothetical protein
MVLKLFCHVKLKELVNHLKNVFSMILIRAGVTNMFNILDAKFCTILLSPNFYSSFTDIIDLFHQKSFLETTVSSVYCFHIVFRELCNTKSYQ